MNTTSTPRYLVTVTAQDWDNRQQAFVSGTYSPHFDEVYTDAATALAAYARQVGEAEKWASYDRSPVMVEIRQMDEDGEWTDIDVLGPDGKPFVGYHYYGGRNCKGLRVLWAHVMHGSNGGPKYRRSELLGYIDGRNGQPVGEWELRHADDRAGAMYADEIFDTDEQAREYFAEHPELVELLHEMDRQSLGL
jgi:hypothetical protein